MKPEILTKKTGQEVLTVERCAILELSNDPCDPDVSIARARVAPGVTTAWHHLTGVAERYVILEGSGLMEVAAEPQPVASGDVTHPPGVRQRIRNLGAGDLLFLICTPRFSDECYVHLE